MDNSNHDWSYIEKFRSENEWVKLHTDENRIVFIGDSIIAGWNHYSFFKENPHYINRGINGQTTSQILHRFQADVLDLKPKVAVILIGTNDVAENQGPITLEEINDNFRAMIKLSSMNDIKVIICSILPVSEYYWSPKINPFEKIIALNMYLKSMCEELSVHYINFYDEFKNGYLMSDQYSDDGVHPNSDGYQLMASFFTNHSTEFLQN